MLALLLAGVMAIKFKSTRLYNGAEKTSIMTIPRVGRVLDSGNIVHGGSCIMHIGYLNNGGLPVLASVFLGEIALITVSRIVQRQFQRMET